MASYVSVYPPAHSDTYVKATTYSSGYEPYYATDPTTSLIGSWVYQAWLSGSYEDVEQKFNIDLGTAQVVERVYIENAMTHPVTTTLYTEYGVKNVLIYGTNDATAFANTTYSNTTDLILIDSFQVDEHVDSNVADPQYFEITNSTAYRYYVLRIAEAWTLGVWMALRRVELQIQASSGDIVAPTPVINGTAVNTIVGWGDVSPSPDTINGTAVNQVVAWGTISASPIINGVGINTTLSDGAIVAHDAKVGGTAETAIYSWGRIQPFKPVINGRAGETGKVVMPSPQINATASNPIVAYGQIIPTKSIVAGYITKGVISSGGLTSDTPTVSGTALNGVVSYGVVQPHVSTIFGTAVPTNYAAGSVEPETPTISGRLLSTDSSDVIDYDRNWRCNQ